MLIHEVVVPADVWNRKLGVPPANDQWAQIVQDSSHTSEKAFGYLLVKGKPYIRSGSLWGSRCGMCRTAWMAFLS